MAKSGIVNSTISTDFDARIKPLPLTCELKIRQGKRNIKLAAWALLENLSMRAPFLAPSSNGWRCLETDSAHRAGG
jgi:hypothetical protein